MAVWVLDNAGLVAFVDEHKDDHTMPVKAKFRCPGQGKVKMSALCQKQTLHKTSFNLGLQLFTTLAGSVLTTRLC